MPLSAPEFDGCCGIDFLQQGQMVAGGEKGRICHSIHQKRFKMKSPTGQDVNLQWGTYLRLRLA
jgi:hypothetical protein